MSFIGCTGGVPMSKEDSQEMDHSIDGTQTMRGGFPDFNISK